MKFNYIIILQFYEMYCAMLHTQNCKYSSPCFKFDLISDKKVNIS